MRRGRRSRRALAVAGVYLAVAVGAIVYALADPGTYSLNFLPAFLLTAPTSLVFGPLGGSAGGPFRPVVAAAELTLCALLQAAALHLLTSWRHARRAGEESPSTPP
jgi:hypothetical protein